MQVNEQINPNKLLNNLVKLTRTFSKKLVKKNT